MASLRKHPRSPYWYLRSRNLDTYVWEEKSTGLRHDDLVDTRKAQRRAEKVSIDEKRVTGSGNSAAFQSWVPGYLESHGPRYRVAWQAIKAFLTARGIFYPRQIRYEHGADYIAWRQKNKISPRAVGHNTALLEVKFLSQLINEAVRRQLAESNPLARLGIARAAQKVKPELSDEDIKKLRAALKNAPDWMRTAFEISLYTGCRFSETSILMENIDLRKRTIRLRDAKRSENDPRKYFTVPIHSKLHPVFQNLKSHGATVTCELSAEKNGRINYFFRQCGVQASFHSLRVTFVTRCQRIGLSESEAMRLVNHSSKLIHQVYSRLNVEDVRKAQRRIQLP